LNMRILRTGLVVSLTVFMWASLCSAYDYKYYFGLRGGVSTLTGGDSAKFIAETAYGGSLGISLAERWTLDLGATVHRNYNDSTASSSFSLGGDEANATLRWKANRLGATVNRLLFDTDSRLNLYLGGGGGLMVWSLVDPGADTTVDVLGSRNERVDYAASEIYLSGTAGLSVALSQSWSLCWDFQTDYLTGAGAEFASAVKSTRDNWQVSSFVTLRLHFGKPGPRTGWKSDRIWQGTPSDTSQVSSRQAQDGDDDGIPNEADNCLDTPPGAVVDQYGCSVDTDGDGVSDGLDDCPGTDRRAAGTVDIYGCPVDSDYDAVPDYLDACPYNRVGAHVDSAGCPIDSDADGVPDGLDDCPYTLFGVEVDQFGCIDLSMLSKPMVLNIDYPPGSFEIDPNNQERLKQLARVLNFVPAIRLEINGYTDNIGTEVANQKLSEKRARRVRDFLVTQGVDTERIKAFGKGEANFVASNQTADGRASNRRIEILFFK